MSGLTLAFLMVTPIVGHLRGQLGLGLGVAHLGQHLVGARIGGDVEVDAQVHLAAAAGAGRVHVDHVVHAAHLLLDGRGHGLLDGQRVGARVGGLHEDLGRRDVRVERDGQPGHGHQPQQDHQDGDHDGHDGAIDEEPGHGRPIAVRRGYFADSPSKGGRRDLLAGLHLLEALDDDALAGLEALLDEPQACPRARPPARCAG